MSKFKKAPSAHAKAPNSDLETLTAVINLNQMMLKKMNENIMHMADELQQLRHMNSEAQYRFIALTELIEVDPKDLQSIIDIKRLDDFDIEAAVMDENEKAISAETVESKDNLVVLTSTTPDEAEDKGIFRSRIRLSEMNQPELEESLMGKKVGDVVEAQLNNQRHLITILAIKKFQTETPTEV